jgi:hypothetical protein
MGRGSGADAVFAAFDEFNTRSVDKTAVGAVLPVELADEEATTLRMLLYLMLRDKEGRGFDAAEIAATALPDDSPEERAEYLPVIAETSESLVEKGLAEKTSSDPADPSWKLTAAGIQYERGPFLADLLRVPELGTP